MNLKILGGGIIALLVLVGGGVWAYVSLSGTSRSVDEVIPAPSPVETGGLLPITSSSPARPSTSPDSNPIGFRGVCPDTWNGQQDTDGDALPDSVEVVFGTDPNMADSDGDQYADGQEIRAGYDPLDKVSSARLDSDNDGLLDNEECTWHADPFNVDSDGDGFKDGAEVKSGFDPAKKGDGKGSDKIVVITPTPVPTVPVHVSITPPVNPYTPSAPVVTYQPAPVVPSQPASVPAVNIALVPYSQLKIKAQSTPADVRAYLASLDTIRPKELTDGQAITEAIKSAANGNIQPLAAARSRIQQFATALKGITVPASVQEYHQLYVSLIDFTGTRLQTVEQNATGNQQKATQAVLEIQSTLPQYVSRLATLRQTAEGLANK